MSRSAIAKDMAWAVQFLRSYQLEVTSIPGKGVCVKGPEQNIRSAMVEIYCSQYYDIDYLNFARLLLINRDVHLRNAGEQESLPLSALQENDALLDTVRRNMQESFGGAFFASDLFAQYRDDLAAVQMRLVLRHQFDHLGKRRFITYSEQGSAACSPLAMELARRHVDILQQAYQAPIRGAEVTALAALYDRLLREINLPYQKMVLAVFTMEGRAVADHLGQSLLRDFGAFINRIDVFNLYEMRRVDFAAYDAAISTWDPPYYRYSLPLVSCPGVNPAQDRKKLFRKLFIHGFSQEVLHHLQTITQCMTSRKIEDSRSIIQNIAQRYTHDPAQRERIIQTFQDHFSALPYYNADMGISMIFLDHEDCGREVLDIYKPAQPLRWRFSMEIRYVVVVCLGKRWNLSELHLLDQMLQKVQQDRASLESVLQDPKAGWERIWQTVLENLYL